MSFIYHHSMIKRRSFFKIQDDRIRTCDLMVPDHALLAKLSYILLKTYFLPDADNPLFCYLRPTTDFVLDLF